MAGIQTTQRGDKNTHPIETNTLREFTGNGTTTLVENGIDANIVKISITNDDDGATWEVQDGAGRHVMGGICDHVGSWQWDGGRFWDGSEYRELVGLKIIIGSVSGTLRLQVAWK